MPEKLDPTITPSVSLDELAHHGLLPQLRYWVACGQLEPTPRQARDPVTRLLRAFLDWKSNAAPAERWPARFDAVAQAWLMFTIGHTTAKVLEAYLLAGLSPEIIASDVGLTPTQVGTYEKLFFDVAALRNYPALFEEVVLGGPRPRLLHKIPFHLQLKRVAHELGGESVRFLAHTQEYDAAILRHYPRSLSVGARIRQDFLRNHGVTLPLPETRWPRSDRPAQASSGTASPAASVGPSPGGERGSLKRFACPDNGPEAV